MTFRTALAALLASGLATTALAQSASDTDLTGQILEQTAPAPLTGNELDTPPETLSELVGLLNGDGVSVPMEDVAPDTEVTTAVLGDLETGETGSGNTAALDNALARAQTQLDMLQTRVDGDETLSAALEGKGFVSDQVIGVYADADGNVTLLIDDRA